MWIYWFNISSSVERCFLWHIGAAGVRVKRAGVKKRGLAGHVSEDETFASRALLGSCSDENEKGVKMQKNIKRCVWYMKQLPHSYSNRFKKRLPDFLAQITCATNDFFENLGIVQKATPFPKEKRRPLPCASQRLSDRLAELNLVTPEHSLCSVIWNNIMLFLLFCGGCFALSAGQTFGKLSI